MSEKINRLASRCPACAGHAPKRSDAASTNELHTAIAAAEDAIDPHAAPVDQSRRTLAATVAALDGSDIPIDQSTRDGACGPEAAAGAHAGTTTPAAGRTDAPVLVELARLCVARHDAFKSYCAVESPKEPESGATPDEWRAFGDAKAEESRLCGISMRAKEARDEFLSKNRDAIAAAIGGGK